MNRRRLLLSFLMTAAVAFAGCGGGGSGGSGRITDLETQLGDARSALQTAQGAFMAVGRDLDGALMALGVTAMDTDGDGTVGNAEKIARLQQAVADGEAAGQAAGLDGALMALGVTAMDTDGDGTVSMAEKTARLQQAFEAATDALAAVRRALGLDASADEAMILALIDPRPDAMAMKLAPAIADPDGNEMIAGPGETGLQKNQRPGGRTGAEEAITIDVTSTNIVVGADDLGVDAMIDDPQSADPADMISSPGQFIEQTGETRAALRGFEASVYARTTGTGLDMETDTLTVYDNQEAPRPQAWTAYYDGTTARDGVTSVAADGTTGLVTIDNSGNNLDKLIPLFGLADLPTGASDSRVFGADDPATTNEDESAMDMHAGTFNGIHGMYACEAGAGGCEVQTDANGAISAIGGSWTFTPTAASGMISDVTIPNALPDAEFLVFGYWLEENSDGTYGVNVFATGAETYDTNMATFDLAQTTGLIGKAKYSGPATGLYVLKTFDYKGTGTPTSSGQFTADAELTAYFGGGNIPANDHFSISGTVSNFDDADGDPIDNDWSVTLDEALIDTGGGIGSTTPGTTTGGGEWMGQFYGNPVPAAGTTSVTDNPDTGLFDERAPMGVAGEFNAHFTNGHVIGAFGATQDAMQE